MTTTTQLLGADSTVAPAFTFRGKEYRLTHPDQAAKARYESLIVAKEKQAINEAFRLGFITDEDRKAEMIALAGRIGSGDHAAGGSLWAKYHQGATATAGVALYHLSLLTVPDATGYRFATIADLPLALAMLAEPEVLVAFAEVLPRFLELVLGEVPGITPEALAALSAQMALAYTRPTPPSA